jgi:hypothetical protein
VVIGNKGNYLVENGLLTSSSAVALENESKDHADAK